MAKRSRRRTTGGRVTPPAQVWPDDEPGLPPLDAVIAALDGFVDVADRSPLGIEVQVSTFLGQLGAGQGPAEPGEPDHEELVNGLVELCLHHLDHSPPRVVLDFLWVLDAFDPGWIAWPLHDRLAMAALPSRPAWAMDVGQAEVARTVVAEHETGDGFDVAIVARHRSAPHDHVVAVYVDRLLGGLATDLLVHDDAEEYLRLSEDAEGMSVREVDPAAAAATIDEAIDATFAAGVPAAVADGFSPLWAVVEHYVAKLPEGGAPLGVRLDTERAPEEVVDAFLAGIDGLAHGRDRAPLLEAVRFVADELGGDPLRWTAPVTQLVLGAWLPLAELDAEVTERFPRVLRAFVPWAHRQHGWDERYLAEPLEVIRAAEAGELPGPATGGGTVEILEQAVAAGVDLDDEAALDAFLDRYLEEQG